MIFSNIWYYKNLFVLEILIAEFLHTFRLKKRSNYIFRFTLISILYITIGFFFPIFFNDAWYASLMFLTLFAISIPLLHFCYDEPVINILFCAIISYTTQHLAYELANITTSLVEWGETPMLGLYGNASSGRLNSIGIMSLWILLYILCYVVTYCITFVLFGKKVKSNENMRIKNTTLFFLIIGGLLANIIMNSITVYYNTGFLNVLVNSICNFFCCIFLFYAQLNMLHFKELENELELLKQLRSKEKKQYIMSKENIDIINIKCHDMKHQIRRMGQNQRLSDDVIKEIEEAISLYDSVAKTGNNVLDVILTEKSLYCLKNNIILTYVADGTLLNFMEEADVYSLFGNALDNAIEAVMKIQECEKRIIELKIHAVGKLISINVKNSFSGEIFYDREGLPYTTKDDENYHGYGIKSILSIVGKYGGDADFSTDREMFYLNILFPF